MNRRQQRLLTGGCRGFSSLSGLRKGEGGMANGTVYDLQEGCRYRVRKDFTDYYGSRFAEGEILTYQKREFLPYHGGHTIHFGPQTLYLQEEQNADILEDLWTYLEAEGADRDGAAPS